LKHFVIVRFAGFQDVAKVKAAAQEELKSVLKSQFSDVKVSGTRFGVKVMLLKIFYLQKFGESQNLKSCKRAPKQCEQLRNGLTLAI
jgi:hypothetical protein